ncbi:PaaI family thioesterase [Nocardioides caldifontis]|uniref:PaaI family thioesterase n=1 Tax=Nocardioides caldifontis TaxID=2588938 RepID=UPI0013969AA1|nr:PaaI family thioesterase [Nocardioides caldifontis]
MTDLEHIRPGPFAELLGFRTVQVEEGEVVLEGLPGDEHLNAGGFVHGGYLSALLDNATGLAARTRVPAQLLTPHLDIHVQYVRGAKAGLPLTCRATVLSGGRRAVSVAAEVTQEGRLVARASSSHAVVQKPTDDPRRDADHNWNEGRTALERSNGRSPPPQVT